MRWDEIRQQYPDQWLIIDALEAHTRGDRRKLDQMTVVEVCPDGAAAYRRYRELHQQHPQREFYFVHTTREELDIRERHWLGLRRKHAADFALGSLHLDFPPGEVGEAREEGR